MKLFVRKLLVFIGPIVLLYLFPVICLIRAGEICPFSNYLKQLEMNDLWGLAYSGYDKQYKFYMTKDVFQPQVLALGSSRIMQLRSEVINNDLTYYNAGGAIQDIKEFRLFLQKVEYNPKFLILEINQFYFNPESSSGETRDAFSSQVYNMPKLNLLRVLKMSGSFYLDMFLGKINIVDLFQTSSTGLNAIMNLNGFCSDGAYNYGKIKLHPEKAVDYNFKDTFERIKHNNRRFQKCDNIDPNAIEEIDSLLSYCCNNGIDVIAFLPPFAPKIMRVMQKEGGYSYLDSIPKALTPIFKKYNNSILFDYTEIDYNNDYFIDGFHAGEKVQNFIVNDMTQKSSIAKNIFVTENILDSINTHIQTKYHSVDN